MKKKAKWKKWLIIAAVLALVIAGAVYLNVRGAQPAYTQETAKTQDIVTYYTFSGNIQPGDSAVVNASAAGTVNRLYVAEGDVVARDDDLLRMSSGTRYKAPIAGTVTDIEVAIDDDAGAGDKLVRVADYANPFVSIKVDEYDLSALSVGGTASIYIQAQDKTLEGTITEIDQEATVENSIAYYYAKVSVPQDGAVRMGMSCEVSVLKESALMATTITMKALQFDEDNNPYVFCYSRGEEVVAQPVTLGINNGTLVQILDGVKSGELVLIPKSSTKAIMPFAAMRQMDE